MEASVVVPQTHSAGMWSLKDYTCLCSRSTHFIYAPPSQIPRCKHTPVGASVLWVFSMSWRMLPSIFRRRTPFSTRWSTTPTKRPCSWTKGRSGWAQITRLKYHPTSHQVLVQLIHCHLYPCAQTSLSLTKKISLVLLEIDPKIWLHSPDRFLMGSVHRMSTRQEYITERVCNSHIYTLHLDRMT